MKNPLKYLLSKLRPNTTVFVTKLTAPRTPSITAELADQVVALKANAQAQYAQAKALAERADYYEDLSDQARKDARHSDAVAVKLEALIGSV